MNVYDFDGTIYDGDSSIDFFKYCLQRNKRCILILFKFVFFLGLYFLKIVEKERLKSTFFSFIKYFDNIDEVVKDFWKEKDWPLKSFYLTKRKKSDIVISASPEFLLGPVAKKYGFLLIASLVDKNTGEFLEKNCYGEEKVRRLKEKGLNKVKEFYSDSLSDQPLSSIARKSYMVKGETLIEWNQYQESLFKKIKKFIFNRDFITFCAIGIVNVFNGVWIAYVLSLFIKNSIVAYICGFMISLCISYILNTTLNFKKNLNSWIKFAISNIPNFIIQIVSVVLLIDILKMSKLCSYIISACVSVPITFILVKARVYNKIEEEFDMKKKSHKKTNKDFKKKVLSIFLTIFSVMFLIYPASYGLLDLRVVIVFSIISFVVFMLFKKIKFKIDEKYYIWIILILAAITRIGIVLLCESSIGQISDFAQALDLARTGSAPAGGEMLLYYRAFTHWILYPLMVHGVFQIFGSTQLIALLTNSIILIACSVLIYKISSMVFKNKKRGLFASLIYVMWPANIFYTLIFTQEHFGALILLLVLYLFFAYEYNVIEFKHKRTKFLYFVVLGCLLALSSFFKNFAPVFLIAFVIYYFMKSLLSKYYKNYVKPKVGFLVIVCISFLGAKSLIYTGLDMFVGEPVVRNITPCYLNVGFRGEGVYDAINYGAYYDALREAGKDYKKANEVIMSNLKEYFKDNYAPFKKIEFWDNKANILFGGDTRIYWVQASIEKPEDHPTIMNILNTVHIYNNYIFVFLVFLMMAGLVDMLKNKNMELFLLYLIFFGSFLLLILVEAQNRYMYSIQPIVCILAISGFMVLMDFLNNLFFTRKIL